MFKQIYTPGVTGGDFWQWLGMRISPETWTNVPISLGYGKSRLGHGDYGNSFDRVLRSVGNGIEWLHLGHNTVEYVCVKLFKRPYGDTTSPLERYLAIY